MKKWWKNWIVILSIIAALLSITSALTGWFTPKEEIKPGFVCADGTIVSAPENCPRCNEDKICQETEECSCEDCEYQVRCVIQRVEEGEYLLLLNEPKVIAWKRVTVNEITTTGSVTIEVDGEIQEIPTTKQETTINGLKVTTQEIIYNYAKPSKSMVIVKVEKA